MSLARTLGLALCLALAAWSEAASAAQPSDARPAEIGESADAAPDAAREPTAPAAPESTGDEAAARDRALEIRDLVIAIRHEQRRAAEMVAEPVAPDATPLHQNVEMREIARRLPVLQRELQAMDGEKALLEAPAAFP